MLPAHAPLPTACSFVFQLAAGSQTSILMSESLEGVSVAATRQNGGRVAKTLLPRPARPLGSANRKVVDWCSADRDLHSWYFLRGCHTTNRLQDRTRPLPKGNR